MREYIHSRLNDTSAWKKKKTWHHSVTKEALDLIHRKLRLWNRLLETKDPSVAREYKRVRNLVRKQSRQHDRKEQQEVARDSRRFWSYVRGKTTNRSDIGDLKTTDSQGNIIMVKEDKEKASLFAEYFSSVFTHVTEEKN